MTATLRELIVKISADSSVYQREMGRATRMGSDYYRSMEAGSRRAQAAMRRQQQSLREFNANLEQVKSQAVSVGAVLATAFAAQNVVRLADGWNEVNARLRQATSGQEDFRRTQAAIFELSQRTGTVYADNANLFAQSAASMREFGYSSEQVVAVTEALAAGLQLSGANAADSSSVIRQFTQGLSQGVLRGEEFNAVNEAGDRVVRALAAGMGQARKDLKGLADQGQLTIDKVVPALISQLDTLRVEFEDLPGSVQRSGNRVANAFQKWIGGADGATGSTRTLAAGLDQVAENMDAVASAALVLIAGGATKYLATLGASAVGAAKDLITAEAAQVSLANAQALAARQAAETAETQRRGAQLALEQARARVQAAQSDVESSRRVQAAEIERLKTTQASLAAERSLESQRLQAQITDTGRQKSLSRMAELRRAEIAVAKQVQTAEAQLAATTVASSKTIEAAYNERAAAATRAAETTKAANAASAASERASAAAKATTSLGRAGRGVMTLLGGPAGLIALASMAATSWLLFRDGTDEARESLIDINTPLDQAVKKFKEMGEAQRALQLIEWGRQQEQEAQRAQEAFQDILSGTSQAVGGQFAGVVSEDALQALTQAQARLQKAREEGKALVPILQDIQQEFGLPARTLEQWLSLNVTLDNSAQRAEHLAEMQAKLGAEMGKTTTATGEQAEQLNKATVNATKYLDKLEDRLAKAIDPSALAAAKRELEDLGKDVDPEVAAKIREVAQALDNQAAAAEKAKEAEKRREKAIKDANRAAEQLQKGYKDTVAQLDLQIKLSGRATELDRLRYDLQNTKLSQLSDEQKLLLENQAIKLDELNALGEYQDMMAGLQTDQQRLTALTKERLETLQRTTSLTKDERAAARDRVLQNSVSEAPEYGGVDAAVGGASGELIRVAEASAELEKWREEELQRQKDFLNEKITNEEEYKRRVIEIEAATTDQRRQIQLGYTSAALAMTSQLTGDIAGLMEQMGDKSSTAYKVMFGIAKAASIAQAIVNTEVAYTRALAADISTTLANVVRGLGYASVGVIASTALTGMAHDGIDNVPKEGTWLLQKGERVIDSRTNVDLKNFLQRGGQAGHQGEGNVYVDVTIHSDGQSEVKAPPGMEAMGREMKEVVDRHITQRLHREQRPGGMLYQARRG